MGGIAAPTRPPPQLQLGPSRQREEGSLTFLPSALMRSQHTRNGGEKKKHFCNNIFHFCLSMPGTYKGQQKCSLSSVSHCSGGEVNTRLSLFLQTSTFSHLLCFHPPPTSDPQISLCSRYGCNMNERTRGAVCDSLCRFVLRFRLRFLCFSGFFFFLFSSSRGAVEQDKLKRTGVADRGDEATIGKCGIKTVLVKELSGRDCSIEC